MQARLRLSKNNEKDFRDRAAGGCAGGKKPTARSIKQVFQAFEKVLKTAQRGKKTFLTRCRQMSLLLQARLFCGII